MVGRGDRSDHRHERPGRPDRPHGNGQRGHRDQPLLERPGQHRRLRHHRLQDRGLAQRHLRLDRPRRQHQRHRHRLRAHRAGRRRHPPLPRLRHQRQRRRPHGNQREHRDPTSTAPPPPPPPPPCPAPRPASRPRRPDRPHRHRLRAHRAGRRRHPRSPPSTPGDPSNVDRHHRRQINLSTWSAPGSTGGSAITGYKIEVSPNGTSGWTDLVANTNGTGTAYAHTGLAAGDTRHYRVSAINANGAGTASNVDSATTAATAPGAPTGLTATASGATAINLSWSAPGSTGGSAITGYKIEVSPNGTSGWTDLVANTNGTGTAYAHTGLAAGDTRHYRVSAINANGAGDPSNVDSATTAATVPGAPTGLTATASGATADQPLLERPGQHRRLRHHRLQDRGLAQRHLRLDRPRRQHQRHRHRLRAHRAGRRRHPPLPVSAINANGAGTASNVANATTGQTTVTFGASSYTAAEGGATATVAVQLSAAASASVTIPLTKAHRGGATAADYSGVPSNVTFTAGQTRQTFTVTATDDSDKDGGESVQLGFGSLPGGYAPGARRTATVTLVDDDANLIVNFGTERHTTVKVRESDVWHRFILC